jgi:hypothetical protein
MRDSAMEPKWKLRVDQISAIGGHWFVSDDASLGARTVAALSACERPAVRENGRRRSNAQGSRLANRLLFGPRYNLRRIDKSQGDE